MSWARMPTVIVVPVFRLRAKRFGRKSSFLMAFSTAARLVASTRAVPFRMRETVLAETPASFATSRSVTVAGGASGWWGRFTDSRKVGLSLRDGTPSGLQADDNVFRG